MLSSKIKSLAYGVSVACLMTYSQAALATGQTFHIGVAANFANTLHDIIDAFDNEYGYSSGLISFTSDSTANLQACITAGTCPNGPYDLFLAANTAAPNAVSTYGMVYSGVTQTPFFYARGSLVLASVNTDINSCTSPTASQSCGLPTTGSSIYTNFVIADPSKAPYGLAAMQVLNGSGYSLSTTSTYPVGDVHTSPNIGTTDAAVDASPPQYAYGFVAKSQVCYQGVLGGNFVNYVYEYLYSGASSPDPVFGHPNTTPTYGEIIQDGIAIQVSGQTSATQAEILQFINYVTTTAGNNGGGIALIQTYCYGLTP